MAVSPGNMCFCMSFHGGLDTVLYFTTKKEEGRKDEERRKEEGGRTKNEEG